MNAIENGARQAVVNCVKVQAGEAVVIITDRETERLADAVRSQAEKVGARVKKFVMEDFGPRPEDGENPLAFPAELDQALAAARVSFYIATGKAGELHSFRMPMVKKVDEYGLRHAHMPNFIEAMMSTGMASDYAEIQRISRQVHDIVHQAREIRVTTPAGTDLTARFDPKYRWIISDGDIRPGHWSNLPDGEVFTAPVDANGTVVIDGCLGDFFNAKYGDLQGTPLTYELRDSRAVLPIGARRIEHPFESGVYLSRRRTRRRSFRCVGKCLSELDVVFGGPFLHLFGLVHFCQRQIIFRMDRRELRPLVEGPLGRFDFLGGKQADSFPVKSVGFGQQASRFFSRRGGRIHRGPGSKGICLPLLPFLLGRAPLLLRGQFGISAACAATERSGAEQRDEEHPVVDIPQHGTLLM